MFMKFCAILLLCHSSLATTANFTQVYQSNEMDYKWESEASRTHALEDGTFKPEDIEPRFMAASGTRIFTSLNKYHINSISVSLVSLPTSSTSSAFPNLAPFPSWDMHEFGNCNKINEARGLQVDSKGRRLWVLDSGSEKCSAKLWIIDLANNKNEISYPFSFHGSIYDLVIDETPDGTLAYITLWGEEQEHILVFSLEANQSWIVDTPRIKPYSIGLSPNKPRQLYLSNYRTNEMYSIPVAELRKRTQTANPKFIGKWNAVPYNMLIDNEGNMYAVFLDQNYISSWKTSQPFEEQRFYEFAGMNSARPFTLTLDQNGTTLLNFVFNINGEPKYSFSKVEVGAQSLKVSPETDVASGGEENFALKTTPLYVILGVLSGILVSFLVYKYVPWRACWEDVSLRVRNCIENKALSCTPGVEERKPKVLNDIGQK